jgi:hypothetical protein
MNNMGILIHHRNHLADLGDSRLVKTLSSIASEVKLYGPFILRIGKVFINP